MGDTIVIELPGIKLQTDSRELEQGWKFVEDTVLVEETSIRPVYLFRENEHDTKIGEGDILKRAKEYGKPAGLAHLKRLLENAVAIPDEWKEQAQSGVGIYFVGTIVQDAQGSLRIPGLALFYDKQYWGRNWSYFCDVRPSDLIVICHVDWQV